ncbi:hypothetical protein [Algiphilus sp.]|uniref:hypothetical protein n=1 Tax=Algiphilus sp. TaxID=1872431 RepID=UPI0025C50754|nr:hypothetical protein [Algiphilus sp.]MCK5769477.1 hypothetical protein [Algiphilus sp.]
MSVSTQELLEATEDALLKLLQKGWKSVRVNGQEYTQREIGELRALRRDLRRELGAKTRQGGGFMAADFRGGS